MAPKPKPKAGDWREETLDRIRALILEADPEMIEERKWKKPSNGMAGIPVWSHNGIVCTGETYKNYVKMTFAKGAFAEGSFRPLQLQSRRQSQARHRPPRGRQARRESSEGAHSGRRGRERVFSPQLVRRRAAGRARRLRAAR